ncbi:MAG: aldo/keto reductase [Solirubrobacteraceae bacterium]|jgi:aryl-alcohol dehydrogenase-like predicted oxidoreductase
MSDHTSTAPSVTLPGSELEVFPLCLGGNVFGWTADQPTSFAVLDAYLAAGGDFIDTADTYSAWLPGNSGGESESIIGEWAGRRGVRDRVVIATKVAKWSARPGLSPANIAAAIDDSLARLQTDYVDLYYAHAEDPDTPLEYSLAAFDELVKVGKVRAVGLSNFSIEAITAALEICERDGLTRPVAVQPEYSLVAREQADVLALSEREGLACMPYYALASGFLTGKYRPGRSVQSQRSGRASAYLEDPRAERLLAALDEIASAHQTGVAAVAIAWLREQPSVAAPIASARTTEQLAEILPGARLELTDSELERLSDAW